MKTKFIILIVALIPVSVFSQKYKETGYVNAFDAEKTVWISQFEYYNSPGLISSLQTTILYGDTIIEDEKWKIFDIGGVKGLIRSEGSKIIFKPHPEYYEIGGHDESFRLVLYDFSLEKGDEFDYRKVTKVDSIELNDGRKHKRIYFGHSIIGEYSIIEGMGNDTFVPFRMLHAAPDGMDGIHRLICCHVDDELLYMNPDFVDCEGTKVPNSIIRENIQSSKVSVVDGLLCVIYDNASFDVKVYNMEGILVSQQRGNQYEVTISVGDLPRGVYFVQITSDGYNHTQKIVR